MSLVPSHSDCIWTYKYSQRFYDDSTWGHEFVEQYDSDVSLRVFQSSDFPHVFLGGKEEESEAISLAGEPLCDIIDVRNLPEYDVWDKKSFDKIKPLFDAQVSRLIESIQSNSCPIYVHCSAGINRSVSVLGAALSHLTGKSLDTVLSEMKHQRSVIAPHDPYYLMAMEWSGASDNEKVNRYIQFDQDQPLSRRLESKNYLSTVDSGSFAFSWFYRLMKCGQISSTEDNKL